MQQLFTTAKDGTRLAYRVDGEAAPGGAPRPVILVQHGLGFRGEACFHERLIDRIHADVMTQCAPESLTVSGLFSRRGGIDIVPVRSTERTHPLPPRTARQ